MKFIKSVPVAISGLALSTAALGNLLLPYGQMIRYTCGIVSASVLILFILKLIFDFPHVREESKNPVILSAMPTSTMALMLLCTYLLPFIGFIAAGLWYAAVAAHLCLMILFTKRFVLDFELKNVFPSWFVVSVGIVTAAVTAPVMGAEIVGQAAFFIGFTLYFAALVLIILRLKKIVILPEPARPVTAIFTAPMSLCIVGYFSVFDQQNEMLVYFMLFIAAVSYIFVSIMMVSLLKLKFYPSYAAFTFPYVISATAFRTGASFLAERGMEFFKPIAQVSLWIAVLVVVYVLLRYVMFFKQQLKC